MSGVVMGRFGLREFNETATCPKCSGEDIRTSYQRNAHCTHYPDKCVVTDQLREPACCDSAASEHIHRHCQRCRYWWAEDVVLQAHSAQPPMTHDEFLAAPYRREYTDSEVVEGVQSAEGTR